MLNLATIILILIALTLHRYLTVFWEEGHLPYSMGFLIYANIFTVICTVHFIWMFGLLAGIVIALLTFFQIIYSAYLWIFLSPALDTTKVNLTAYLTWVIIVVSLGILLIINFFVFDYKSALMAILGLVDYKYITLWIVFIGSLIVGNLARVISYMAMLKKITRIEKILQSRKQ